MKKNYCIFFSILLCFILNINKANSSVITVIQAPPAAIKVVGDENSKPAKKKTRKLFKKKEYPPLPPLEYQIVKYNFPAGQVKFNIESLRKNKIAVSSAVISPDFSKIVFSEASFFAQTLNTNSKVFYINLDPPTQDIKLLQAIKPIQKVEKPLLESGYNSIDKHIFRLFTVVDWSADSSKVLVKETIGEYAREIWTTRLWVYDFKLSKATKLSEINDAIIFYWRNKKNIDLKTYKWDIEPLGWSSAKPDQILVNAIGYKKGKECFLGRWRIDAQGNMTVLDSLELKPPLVQQNGLVIKYYQR